jgi:hypothetical protein
VRGARRVPAVSFVDPRVLLRASHSCSVAFCVCVFNWVTERGDDCFQLESSPTVGSVETSDSEKRTLAKKSREYNLKSKLFCDMFPELAEVCSEGGEE